MTEQEKSRWAFEAANSAQDVQRALLSVAESLRRGERPDFIMAGNLPDQMKRLGSLIDLVLSAPEA